MARAPTLCCAALLAALLRGAAAQDGAAAADTAAPPNPDSSGSGVLYTSVGGGVLTVIIVCSVICYADRRAMKRKYEIRAMEAEQRGLPSPARSAGGGGGGGGDPEAGADGGEGGDGPSYGSRDPGASGFDSAVMDVDGAAFEDAVNPSKEGLAGTKLSGDLEYLRSLPDLRMPRLPGIRAMVEIDGVEISFKPGEEAMRQATAGSTGRGILEHTVLSGAGGGSSIASSSVVSSQTETESERG